jgi:hypothetical protein
MSPGEGDIKRLAEAVAKDPDAKLLDVQLKKVDIIEYYDDDTKKLAESANISIKDCQHIIFILKYGTGEQKEQVNSGKRSTNAVYKDVLKQMKQKRKSKKRRE